MYDQCQRAVDRPLQEPIGMVLDGKKGTGRGPAAGQIRTGTLQMNAGVHKLIVVA
jgi:hypothetical protein